jgi:hypothetical protein
MSASSLFHQLRHRSPKRRSPLDESLSLYVFSSWLSVCVCLSCLVLSCLVLSCLVLSCIVLSCLVLSCLALSCRVVVVSCRVVFSSLLWLGCWSFQYTYSPFNVYFYLSLYIVFCFIMVSWYPWVAVSKIYAKTLLAKNLA